MVNVENPATAFVRAENLSPLPPSIPGGIGKS